MRRDPIEAARRRVETTQRAGVGARDMGHVCIDDFTPFDPVTVGIKMEDLWACISALAKRVEELERRK